MICYLRCPDKAQHLISRSSLLWFVRNSDPIHPTRTCSEADAEQVLRDETAAVDLFVCEEAVLRITLAAQKEWGHDDGDGQNNGNEETSTGVSQVDQGHLNEVITEVRAAVKTSPSKTPLLNYPLKLRCSISTPWTNCCVLYRWVGILPFHSCAKKRPWSA